MGLEKDQRSYLFYVLELHLGPSEGAGVIGKMKDSELLDLSNHRELHSYIDLPERLEFPAFFA
jgi:hypothetical protein